MAEAAKKISEGEIGEPVDEAAQGGEITGERIIQQADIDILLEAAQKGADEPRSRRSSGKILATPDIPGGKDNLKLLMDIGLNVRIELGKAILPLDEVLRLHEGSVVELDKLAGDPLDIIVNGRLIARGEVLVLNDNFCVRITDILGPEERLKAGTKKQ